MVGKKKSIKKTNQNVDNILPPELMHIGDNCFANVIFQSLAFLDFYEETNFFMKSSETWIAERNNDCGQNLVQFKPIFNKDLVSSFPTQIFKDFEPNKRLLLEKAMIRYNDADFEDGDAGELSRSLFNHPLNLYVNTRYLSSLDQSDKEHFCMEKMNMFSRFILEYDQFMKANELLGYFTSASYPTCNEEIINEIVDVAHAETSNLHSEPSQQDSLITCVTKIWKYLFVLPRAIYIDRFPVNYIDKEKYENGFSMKETIGLYCPW